MKLELKQFLMASTLKIVERKKELCYDTWIFSSSFNTKFNYNSKYFFEYILKNEPNIKPIFVINDEKLLEELAEQYGQQYFVSTDTLHGLKKVLQAGVWVTSAGLPCYGVKVNRKRIIVNLWHGVPLKKIVLEEENINIIKQLYIKIFYSRHYSCISSTSEKMIPIMAKSFGVSSEKIKVLGQPRNDMLSRLNNRQEILKRFYGEIPEYKHLILYAPTYRDYVKTRLFPFDDFMEEDLQKFLEDKKMMILIRTHQSESDQVAEREFGDRVKLINDDLVKDIMDVLNIFDLIITDYSSIYIDFLITQKPILFLPYDKAVYLEKRGFNFEYDKYTPGPQPQNYQDFKNELDNLLSDKSYYLKERMEIDSYFNAIKKNSSERVSNYIKRRINEISSLT